MNPRVSRSSALASKATGYPIAKVAAKLAVGYTLDEIPNDLTGTTPASFEPTLDYVVVKVPRFAFEKFPGADTTLGTQMKSVGEAMGIGRTFTEALSKALRSRELDGGAVTPWPSLDELPEGLHPWFRAELERAAARLAATSSDLVADDWLRLKRLGHSDAAVARACGVDEETARAARRAWGVRPGYRRVDSCAGEVEAASNYFYSTWGEADEAAACAGGSVVILGSGPNRIGQGIEFDYCCVHAAQSFRALGYEAVMVNCNPETVSTDYDTSDRLYFEPLGVEEVLAICEREQPAGVVIQFGGQTPLKLARAIEAAGFRVLGTPFEAVDLAEDRERFAALCDGLGIAVPPWGTATTADEAVEVAERVGYPVLVRPELRARRARMRVCYDAEAVREAAAVGGHAARRPLPRERDRDRRRRALRRERRPSSPPSCSTSRRRASTRATRAACCPPPSLTRSERRAVAHAVRRLGPGARRGRAAERPARARRRRALRAGGEPARLADGAVREQGDRRQPRPGRLPARRGRDARRARAGRDDVRRTRSPSRPRCCRSPASRAPTRCSARRCARPAR